MKSENWSIRKMREERLLSSVKNSYRTKDQNPLENPGESQDKGNQTTLSLFLNRVKVLLEDEPE